MNHRFVSGLPLLAAALMSAGVAADNRRSDEAPANTTSFAVIGDWPYSQNLLNNHAKLVDSVNADKNVGLMIHVGDIHSGSMPCTSAHILPPIQASNPGWNQSVYSVFQQVNAPVVYTPGDNEWADCHKTKQKSSGAPLKELASVRELFFAKPGETLGRDVMRVESQAQHFDPAYPQDAEYVENVIFEKSDVVFVTINVPGGSNNDAAAWGTVLSGAGVAEVYRTDAQLNERTARTDADRRWLERAFERARRHHARGVVIITQADLWDPEFSATNQLGNYAPVVERIADLSSQFGRPVLLLNGDTHQFVEDYPLADPGSTTGKIYNLAAVPNLRRVVVKGSTNMPAEWLRITIERRNPKVFSVIRPDDHVQYCSADTPTCQ